MISNPDAARLLLGCLELHQGSWCFLHGESRLAEGDLDSDIDLVTSDAPLSVIRSLVAPARANGLLLAMTWRYDAYSISSFWLDEEGRDVVQLDLSRDLSGGGKYGIRTPALLAAAEPGTTYPTVNKVDELTHLLVKKLYKGQFDRAGVVVDALGAHADEWLVRAHETLSPSTLAQVQSFVERGTYRRPTRRFELARLPERLLQPTGVALRVSASDVIEARAAAEFLLDWFRGKFPRVAVLDMSSLVGRVISTAWTRRPGLVLLPTTVIARDARAVVDASLPSPEKQTVVAMHRIAVSRL